MLLVGVLDSGPPLSPDSENCIGNIHPREIYPVIDHVEARIYDILDSVFSPLNLQVKASRKNSSAAWKIEKCEDEIKK